MPTLSPVSVRPADDQSACRARRLAARVARRGRLTTPNGTTRGLATSCQMKYTSSPMSVSSIVCMTVGRECRETARCERGRRSNGRMTACSFGNAAVNKGYELDLNGQARYNVSNWNETVCDNNLVRVGGRPDVGNGRNAKHGAVRHRRRHRRRVCAAWVMRPGDGERGSLRRQRQSQQHLRPVF
jgi:hypothetical protein